MSNKAWRQRQAIKKKEEEIKNRKLHRDKEKRRREDEARSFDSAIKHFENNYIPYVIANNPLDNII